MDLLGLLHGIQMLLQNVSYLMANIWLFLQEQFSHFNLFSF